MRVYLDNCCYNRPFDDQTQLKVRLETERFIALTLREPMDYTKWRARNLYLDDDLHALAARARRTGGRFEAIRQQRVSDASAMESLST